MVLPEFLANRRVAGTGRLRMTSLAAHNDSHARYGATDASQAAFSSPLRLFNVVLNTTHPNTRNIRGQKRICGREKLIALCCLFLFVMESVLTRAQSVLQEPTSPVPLISVDSSAVSAAHLLETIHGSARDDAQFAVDKLTPTCQGIPLSTDAFDRASRQWQAEWTTGNQLAEKIERDATLIEDPGLTAYMNSLERTIVRHSDLHGCFRVKILHDPEPNAFALPGGFLYITTGLLLIADSEGELTAALAHENAHVTAHHFARIDQKRRLCGRLVLAGGPAGYLVRRFLGPLLTRKLIRNSEFEADQLSLQYQSASGYDPSEFSRLLHNAFQDQGKPPSFLERLFDTHPLTSTRIKRLDKAKDRLPPRTMDQPVDTSRFQQAKERLVALLKVAVPVSSLSRAHQ